MIIERLSHDNFDEFDKLLHLANQSVQYRIDFHQIYSSKSFIVRYIIRKSTKLLVVDNKYIGYIWSERKSNNTITIKDIYIMDEYVKIFNKHFLKILQCEYILFECFENSTMLNMLNVLNMKRIKVTNIMKYDMSLYNSEIESKDILSNITFDKYIKRKDAKIRCILQNAIFENQNRTPLSVDDIYYDEDQEYFLDNMNFFMKFKNNYIGYGQIIHSRNIYIIVNFGIIQEYRHLGMGIILLNKLISRMKETINKDIYIRVDSTNIAAKHLYKKAGFIDVGVISTWLYTP